MLSRLIAQITPPPCKSMERWRIEPAAPWILLAFTNMNIQSPPAVDSMEDVLLSPTISQSLPSATSVQVAPSAFASMRFSPSPLPPLRSPSTTAAQTSPPPFSATGSSPILSSMHQSSRSLGSPTIPYSSLSSLPSPRLMLQPEPRPASRSSMPPLESFNLRSPPPLAGDAAASASAASASSVAASASSVAVSAATVEQLEIGDDGVVSVRIAGPFTARHSRLRKLRDVEEAAAASSSSAAAATVAPSSSSSMAAAAPSAAASSSSSAKPWTSKPFSSVTFDYTDDEDLVDVADAAAAGGRQASDEEQEEEQEAEAAEGEEKTPQQLEDEAYARVLLKFINKKRARGKVHFVSYAAERRREKAAARANK